MATVIKGLLSQNLPWGLVIAGMGIAAVMELCGVHSLPFAVGVYLPLSSTTPIFAGGVVKWIIDRTRKTKEDSEVGPGALFSSGLIAGGALTGILIAILIGAPAGLNSEGKPQSVLDILKTGVIKEYGNFSDLISLIFFLLLAFILYRFATSRKSDNPLQ